MSFMLSAEEQVSPMHRTCWDQLQQKANRVRDTLPKRLENDHVVGDGAAAKGTVLAQYCGLTKQYLAYVVDNTPEKQGCLVPGTDIPVVSPEEFRAMEPPNAILATAWNHVETLKKVEPWLKGNWIVP